jgi:hypothetical protein
MLQVRRIVLRGLDVADAKIDFTPGGNIVAGDSDTGKSYLLRCLDYIFGADEMTKRIPEAEPYSTLFVQFENSSNEVLTLERHLSGGDLASHNCAVEDIAQPGDVLSPKRAGKSNARDVTEVMFAFAGIREADLRKNDRGSVQRLTMRLFMPVVLVDEITIIDEVSPVLGDSAYDTTVRKRMFAYMLTGKDDQGIIAAEKAEIAKARLAAQIGLISDLLEPIEKRIGQRPADDDTIDKVENAIYRLSSSLSEASGERAHLQQVRVTATETLQRAHSQMIAAEELLTRYRLLNSRYDSDLQRLDFVTEGAHFFDGLQAVTCPLCEQPMTGEHLHAAGSSIAAVYESARAEAAKILGQREDLAGAMRSLEAIKGNRAKEHAEATAALERADRRIADVISPAMKETTALLDRLVARRVELEGRKADDEQAEALRTMKSDLERVNGSKPTKREWESLPTSALRSLCIEIEAVLKDWQWSGEGRVEFDQKAFDIVVDGQARQSHGKGVRAVLHSAFTIGLLRYCRKHNRPHPGMVLIDSPLTSYKKGRAGGPKNGPQDGPVDAGIEAAFWRSLAIIDSSVQVIIVENKEPPQEVAGALNYHWFAGDLAQPGDRRGFIPD